MISEWPREWLAAVRAAGLSGEGEVVGDTEHGVVDAVAFEAAVAEDLPGLHAGDNALMESQIGLYKTELIKPRRPWHGLADVELTTAERVDWFNNQRLHTAIGDIPPHEHGTNHYAQHQPQPTAGVNA
ncbi:hypothetical protein GCM10010250_20000 [Streptomyces althioticus]|nr:hypothetical protein GCM10010250_20000 [Streptomyces althioticus]